MSDMEKNASENSPAESEYFVSDEDLSNVSASKSELVGDDMKSLNFGKSMFDESELQWMVKNRMLKKADVRLPPQNETIPRPEPNECVVFHDYFAASFRMPCQDFVEEILKAYNIEMHHFDSKWYSKNHSFYLGSEISERKSGYWSFLFYS
jgi:hypothetical protein